MRMMIAIAIVLLITRHEQSILTTTTLLTSMVEKNHRSLHHFKVLQQSRSESSVGGSSPSGASSLSVSGRLGADDDTGDEVIRGTCAMEPCWVSLLLSSVQFHCHLCVLRML